MELDPHKSDERKELDIKVHKSHKSEKRKEHHDSKKKKHRRRSPSSSSSSSSESDRERRKSKKKSKKHKHDRDRKRKHADSSSDSSSESDAPVHTKRKRQKKERDPNAPKRPQTAYFLFASDKRPTLDDKSPKHIAELWRNAPAEEKSQYEQRAEGERVKYRELVARYNESKTLTASTAE